MWFSKASRNLAEELGQWLDQLSSEPDTAPPRHCEPRLRASLERLQRGWQELLSFRQHAERQPPAPCSAEEYQDLTRRLAQAEQQNQQLRDELEQQQRQLGELEAERRQWQEERQVWELTQRTLTEGCWAMNVVNGDPDHPHNLIRWSEQFRELIGYRREEFPDGWDSYFGVVNPDDLKTVMQTFNAAMADSNGDGSYAVEYRMRHKSRGEIWFRERGRCLRDNRGRLLYVTGAVREISDEKAAAALHESTVRFPPTDIAAIARGFGFDALRVTRVDDLTAVRAWLDGPRDRPLLIDAKVTADRGSWWLEEAFRGH